jgi:multidrug efflux pump subunit AcrB
MTNHQAARKVSVVVASAGGYCILAVATVVLTYTFLTWPDKRGRSRPGVDGPPGPVILVETAMPGAGAPEVVQAIADPLEEQIQKITGLRYLTSRCDDGAYRLAVAFVRGVPGNQALTAVRDVVGYAREGVLAEPVRRNEFTVREQPAGLQLVVTVSSPTHPEPFLSAYARREVKEKLARLSGVAEVALFGGCEACETVRLDPEKLAARGLTVADVGRSVREQKGQVAPGLPGCFNVLWNSSSPEQGKFAEVILKTDTEGRIVRLRDVAEIKDGCHQTGSAVWNGKRVVALGIYPTPAARPDELVAAVRAELANLKPSLLKDVRVEVGFDFTGDGPACLLMDVLLPDAAARQRTEETLRRCAGLAKPVAGDVLELTDPPLVGAGRRPNQGYVLIGLAAEDAADREQAVQAIRKRLAAEVVAAQAGLRVVAEPGRPPHWSYPLALAVHGPEYATVQALAEDLAERMAKSAKLTDVLTTRGPSAPAVRFEVNYEAVKANGVALQDVHDALAIETAAHGPMDVGHSPVRDGKGQPIFLRRLIRVRGDVPAGSLRRFDGRPMARVMANPAPGMGLDEARTLCEELFEAATKGRQLPEEYRLSWLDE